MFAESCKWIVNNLFVVDLPSVTCCKGKQQSPEIIMIYGKKLTPADGRLCTKNLKAVKPFTGKEYSPPRLKNYFGCKSGLALRFKTIQIIIPAITSKLEISSACVG